ncbi:DUF971 domain-containing protein [Chromobacterium violaceum]|uniref:1-(5-phosphoribosyl)-5-((5-phosphoribosylamino)methylideneamino)imidazole-4-carboxamide isomerase n=1 Tax=Chromobacterium violaceum TaxID=536 RepID=A0A202BBL3_CHRVL|nr:DUF971 domain-containing protein [Chromobacterium violaceum]ATP27740.1 DUF971 domain-containing protein [Chromobacterium violaceum]KMN49866.1 1-(5-phosphoribosyl)-5-[(5-phosphoribosylamino)methylideneamino] imidazole-4-carboxamide isomerase [Chromobacterium violaceum]KMN85372.1 1-(5-phosphoribosyl)-5-[(5-phosphoribosylamino)methylideneamino] imidazole-4-carboxamide isomerase [Chromobacterium violaceum]KMN90230.1 1-(5-phosphoribosyl)-5-[(5-phosphoribosylamino)methylideneamino] imidazole-4-car
MSGLAPDAAQPVEIQLHQVSKILEIAFDDGARFELPCEYLRVYSPSAEVRGHGVGQETLQTGKMHVGITALEPVGHYALKITFDDGHDSGLYSWTYLYELGAKRGQYWQQYLDKLAAAGASRE